MKMIKIRDMSVWKCLYVQWIHANWISCLNVLKIHSIVYQYLCSTFRKTFFTPRLQSYSCIFPPKSFKSLIYGKIVCGIQLTSVETVVPTSAHWTAGLVQFHPAPDVWFSLLERTQDKAETACSIIVSVVQREAINTSLYKLAVVCL